MVKKLSEQTVQKDTVAGALARVAAEGVRFADDEPGLREMLIETARDLLAAAECPVELLLWSIWAMPTRTAATRIAVDLQIFKTATQDDSHPKIVVELAATTEAAP
ncbi:hypothetical protein F5Y19DRAFT_488227 [Xylariaceae sp. FL1651]|nr:hypothetical protein F5Y19DRAFT_488227 [Xylariaceae sp. FL1651]